MWVQLVRVQLVLVRVQLVLVLVLVLVRVRVRVQPVWARRCFAGRAPGLGGSAPEPAHHGRRSLPGERWVTQPTAAPGAARVLPEAPEDVAKDLARQQKQPATRPPIRRTRP